MNNLFENAIFSGAVLSLVAYFLGLKLKERFKLAIINPILVSIIISILVLILADIDFEVYYKSANYLNWLLTPATVCLAVPLYEQWELLKKNKSAVVCGILAGVITSMTSIFLLSYIFGLSHKEYVTFLPKSITTAMGMTLSEEMNGYVTITIAVIVITGILGNIFGESICKVFKIKEPISVGLSLGTSAHAIGAAKATEIGEIEGAMSGLSIAVAGIFTVLLAPFFGALI